MAAIFGNFAGKLRGSDPGMLKRLFVVVGGLSIICILLGSAWGFRMVFTSYVVKMAESDALAICELILDFSQDRILKGAEESRKVAMSSAGIANLDANMAPFMDHMDVTKVKIFDLNHRIVYSTDKNIIGKVDYTNQRLLNALAGNVDTELKEKKTPDLRGESVFTQKVVETYVPIKNNQNKVVGSFEIYLLISKYDKAIQRGMILTTMIMALVLIGTFAISYLIIRKTVLQVQDAHGLLQQVAVTDALTGTANRGYLVLRGKEEFDRAQRSYGLSGNKGLGCLLLDLDHFKLVNDTYGHLVGDQVLCEFVARVQQVLRPYDLLGRYGGEEFMVLLPETSSEEAFQIAARVLEVVRERAFVYGDFELKITTSAGVATSYLQDQTFDALIKRADDNLYTAKQKGRDQVCSTT